MLDARDVVWVGAMQITTGIFFLVEFDQHFLPAGFAEQIIVLRLGPVTPEDVLGSVRDSTSCTQSRTAWLVGLFSPMPAGGEMAGATFSMVLRPATSG